MCVCMCVWGVFLSGHCIIFWGGEKKNPNYAENIYHPLYATLAEYNIIDN